MRHGPAVFFCAPGLRKHSFSATMNSEEITNGSGGRSDLFSFFREEGNRETE